MLDLEQNQSLADACCEADFLLSWLGKDAGGPAGPEHAVLEEIFAFDHADGVVEDPSPQQQGWPAHPWQDTTQQPQWFEHQHQQHQCLFSASPPFEPFSAGTSKASTAAPPARRAHPSRGRRLGGSARPISAISRGAIATAAGDALLRRSGYTLAAPCPATLATAAGTWVPGPLANSCGPYAAPPALRLMQPLWAQPELSCSGESPSTSPTATASSTATTAPTASVGRSSGWFQYGTTVGFDIGGEPLHPPLPVAQPLDLGRYHLQAGPGQGSALYHQPPPVLTAQTQLWHELQRQRQTLQLQQQAWQRHQQLAGVWQQQAQQLHFYPKQRPLPQIPNPPPQPPPQPDAAPSRSAIDRSTGMLICRLAEEIDSLPVPTKATSGPVTSVRHRSLLFGVVLGGLSRQRRSRFITVAADPRRFLSLCRSIRYDQVEGLKARGQWFLSVLGLNGAEAAGILSHAALLDFRQVWQCPATGACYSFLIGGGTVA